MNWGSVMALIRLPEHALLEQQDGLALTALLPDSVPVLRMLSPRGN